MKKLTLKLIAAFTLFGCNTKNTNDTAPIGLCQDYDFSYVYYNTNTKNVHICVEGESIDSFKASHGSKGVGKTKKGDRKTPLGLYTIQQPRPSSSIWRTFIHIDYPTKSQKEQGYSGGSVGLHGPSQYFPFANNLVNYGAGCIVVSDNESIDLIANYVENFLIKHIYID